MKLIKRDIFKEVLLWLKRPEIIVITGMRQVGKTTLLKMLLNEIDSANKVYIDLEDFNLLEICNEGPEKLLKYLELQGFKTNEKLYIFIDEIQYLNNPSNFLKLVHDHYQNLKLIVTGSSSMEIKQKFKDSLTGRKITFELTTFSFNEFLHLKDKEVWSIKLNAGSLISILNGKFNSDVNLLVPQMNNFLLDYLIYGGFPKTILEENKNIKTKLLSDIHSSYVRKDIKDIANILDIISFNNLIKLLSSQITGLLNLNEISSTLGLHLNTLKRYLFLLENSFVISMINPFYSNKRKEISKMQKVFFQDLGLRNVILNNFLAFSQRSDIGTLFENFVFMELKRNFRLNENLFYWRTTSGTEVDFIIKKENELIPIEVKAKDFKSPKISRSFRSFIFTYKPKTALIINMNFSAEIIIEGCNVKFVPAFLL